MYSIWDKAAGIFGCMCSPVIKLYNVEDSMKTDVLGLMDPTIHLAGWNLHENVKNMQGNLERSIELYIRKPIKTLCYNAVNCNRESVAVLSWKMHHYIRLKGQSIFNNFNKSSRTKQSTESHCWCMVMYAEIWFNYNAINIEGDT